MLKRLPTMREAQVQSLGWENLLEKEMATHSRILAWKIPWMEEPGRLQSMVSQRDTTERFHFPLSLSRSVGAHYVTGNQWRNNFRKNEETEPKQKQHPVVDVTGDGRKVQCCKEQYCIGTLNVWSMNQGKLEEIKQEMARANVDILGISELK